MTAEPPRPERSEAFSIGDFLGDPPRRLAPWRWLWEGDHRFPIRSHRGVLGRLIVAVKRLVRPLVKVPQNDLWERQRAFNLGLLGYLEELAALRHEDRIKDLETFLSEGLDEVMRHNDALFARVDQKLDRYRRESHDLLASLGSALALLESGGEEEVPAAEALGKARQEHGYLELEQRFRGTPEEIRERISSYLPYLGGDRPVLDLGCGRGEALEVLREHGIEARGVDSSRRMVEECRERGLEAAEGDLFEVLAAASEGSLGGVVSFHVIEHLAAPSLDRLVRLAWRALAAGGVLILETPNPLSVVVAARNFWLDPTHRRPIHPESLKLLLELAGFRAVEHLELRPFRAEERLPEIDLRALPAEQQLLADRVNRLRDRLDAVLFGFQDYAVIGRK